MIIILFFIAHWYFSLFFQTFFHHRYAAHRMFTMSKAWEKVFFMLSFIFQGSSYLSPYAYAILHRMHHEYADTEKDPHSPKFTNNLFKMMWQTKVIYTDIFLGKVPVEDKYKKDVPEWHKMELMADKWVTRLLWFALYCTFYWYFDAEPWMYLLLPIHFVMGPFHGAIINWFAHKYGYVNFPVKDTSKNLLPFDFLMLGEGYHNNHHKFGGRANFGVKWHEFDPVYPFILLFDWLGIISLKKRDPVIPF